MESRKMIWAGWILSILPALLILMSGAMKLFGAPGLAEGFEHVQLPLTLATGLGILEVAVTLIYLIPQTAVLGAILLTGLMGGAILTHLRVGDPWIMQLLIGAAVWGGLYLREPRVRALIPFVRRRGV